MGWQVGHLELAEGWKDRTGDGGGRAAPSDEGVGGVKDDGGSGAGVDDNPRSAVAPHGDQDKGGVPIEIEGTPEAI